MAGIQHGGGLTAAVARYGGAAGDWLDLSTGINPNPPDLPDIPIEVWNRLPDRGLVEAARVAAREWYCGGQGLPPSVLPDISPSRGEIGWGAGSNSYFPSVSQPVVPERVKVGRESISPLEGEMSGRTEGGKSPDVVSSTIARLPLPVPGTQAFIQILPRLVPQNRPVAVLSPTYGEYAHCFKKSGFAIDALGSLDAIAPEHGAVIIVNPNNPDGRTFSRTELLDLYLRLRGQGTHLHVDEAFGDARPELSLADIASRSEGLTVSRSFGKFFGMAGIRLGFVFGLPETLDAVEVALGPWAVSGPALYIARALMSRDRNAVLESINTRRAALQDVLERAGLQVAGGSELFALVTLDNAAGLFEHLAASHILTRKFAYAPQWLRIGLTPDEKGDRRLAEALASYG